MGVTHVTVAVAPIGNKKKPWKALFLVDSGATTSMVPGKFLRQMGIRPFRKDGYELADGAVAKFDVGGAMFTVKGVTVLSEVAFGLNDAEPLLGAQTLQSANLIWDAAREELVPSPRLKPLKPIAGRFTARRPSERGVLS